MDFASLAESLLGDATTFFADGLHPNDRGGAAMAAIVPIDEMLR